MIVKFDKTILSSREGGMFASINTFYFVPLTVAF